MESTISNIIKQEILVNLLAAHNRISRESSDIKGIIKLSKFILSVSKNMNNEIIQFASARAKEINNT